MDETRNDRANSGRRTFLRLLLVAGATPPVLLTLSLFGFFPWSDLNCRRSEIDINSGRIRHTRYLFWRPFTRSVEDSVLTRALSPEDLAGRPADWHTVVTQIREMEMCWEIGKMTPAARREMGRRVVRLWREAGSYFPAGEYIQTAWEKALEAEKQGKVMDVDDLPVPK
jgi:hypothetical protein